jgi:hypothetical protein
MSYESNGSIGTAAERKPQVEAAAVPHRRISDTIEHLLLSHQYAVETKCDQWDFAVEIQAFLGAGASRSDLRWLICKGYVLHAEETTGLDHDRRSFRQVASLAFTDRTCLILTEQGVLFARSLRDFIQPPQVAPARGPTHLLAQGPEGGTPVWDSARQELRFVGILVKQFKVPAPNQETILASLEEEHWPTRIDDPLSPTADIDPKRRLHDTINALNRNQKHRLIRFLGDGSGQGIRWEPFEIA